MLRSIVNGICQPQTSFPFEHYTTNRCGSYFTCSCSFSAFVFLVWVCVVLLWALFFQPCHGDKIKWMFSARGRSHKPTDYDSTKSLSFFSTTQGEKIVLHLKLNPSLYIYSSRNLKIATNDTFSFSSVIGITSFSHFWYGCNWNRAVGSNMAAFSQTVSIETVKPNPVRGGRYFFVHSRFFFHLIHSLSHSLTLLARVQLGIYNV